VLTRQARRRGSHFYDDTRETASDAYDDPYGASDAYADPYDDPYAE